MAANNGKDWEHYLTNYNQDSNKLIISLSTATNTTQEELLNMRYIDFLEMQCAYTSLVKGRQRQKGKPTEIDSITKIKK